MRRHLKTRGLWYVLFLEAALLLTLISSQYRESFTKISVPAFPIVGVDQGTGSFAILSRFLFQNQDSLKAWEEKTFKGKTNFVVHQKNETGFLSATSQDACSGLYTKVNYEATPDLYLSWKWKVVRFPQKKEPDRLSNKSEDDFAARVYAIFPGSNFFKSDVIEYVWDENIPTGTAIASPYSERVKLFVIRRGAASPESDGWEEEERNLYEDYRKLFGKEPERPVGAVALMSDSDNTGTQSEADFADFTFKKKLTVAKRRSANEGTN